MYRLVYESKAQKQLKKLDGATRRKIISWMTKNVDNSSNPYQHAKLLKGNLSGYCRHRVGDYRIICDIQDDKLVVLAVDIAHRREVYK